MPMTVGRYKVMHDAPFDAISQRNLALERPETRVYAGTVQVIAVATPMGIVGASTATAKPSRKVGAPRSTWSLLRKREPYAEHQ